MSYVISEYTKKKARELNVTVLPSTKKNKKLDVFDKTGKKIASIGAAGMMDYPSYIKEKGIEYANQRRSAYRARFKGELSVVGSNSWWGGRLLW